MTGKTNPFMILRSDGIVIPADPNNTDWQAYQKWLVAGNVPTPAPAPPPVIPPPVKCVALRLALVDKGEFTAVDNALSNATDQGTVQSWQYGNTFARDSAFITGPFKAAGSFADADLDALFAAAALLAV